MRHLDIILAALLIVAALAYHAHVTTPSSRYVLYQHSTGAPTLSYDTRTGLMVRCDVGGCVPHKSP